MTFLDVLKNNDRNHFRKKTNVEAVNKRKAVTENRFHAEKTQKGEDGERICPQFSVIFYHASLGWS